MTNIEVMETATPHPGTDFVGVDGQTIKRFYPSPPPHLLGWTPNWMCLIANLHEALRQAHSPAVVERDKRPMAPVNEG